MATATRVYSGVRGASIAEEIDGAASTEDLLTFELRVFVDETAMSREEALYILQAIKQEILEQDWPA